MAKSAAHLAFEAEQLAKKERLETEKLDRISSRVRTGQSVSGDELLELARQIEVAVHARTAGALKTLEWITEDRASSKHSSKTASQAVFEVYSSVKKALG